MNHLSNPGKEIKRDSLSSGERTGKSPNHISGVVGLRHEFVKTERQEKLLGRSVRECESHVSETDKSLAVS